MSGVPHFTCRERVFRDGVLVHAAGDVIPVDEARRLGLIAVEPAAVVIAPEVEPTGRRMRRLPEDRMAGHDARNPMEDR